VRVVANVAVFLLSACLHADEEVVKRAARDVSCPVDQIRAVPRPELSEATYDVDACGHLLRYTCSKSAGYPLTCARAPDPQPAPQVTVYRLQDFEPLPTADAAPTGDMQLPRQIQTWVMAGASLLPPGLLPPGLLPGTDPAAPASPDASRFHGFRILDWEPVKDSSVKYDIVDLFGRDSNFQNTPPTCMFAEFGFAIVQANAPTPADILVSLSCGQVEAFNFRWPYTRTGLTPDSSRKVASIAQRVFQAQ
jgi:hypothetical protein